MKSKSTIIRGQKCRCWRERNWQSSGKKRTLSWGRFSFHKWPKEYDAKKNQKLPQEPKSVQEIRKKAISDLIQWNDELQVEKNITLKDFDKWRKNGNDEALQNRCNLTLNRGAHRKKPISAQKEVATSCFEQRKNWARRPTQFRLTVHL